MKKRLSALSFAWMLLGLLVLAAGLMVLGSRERKANPSAQSYGPSGARALAELLRQSGFRVEVSPYRKPRLERGDLAIGFVFLGNMDWFSSNPEDFGAAQAVRKHVEAGGRGLILRIGEDFSAATQRAKGGERDVALDTSLSERAQARFRMTSGTELQTTMIQALSEETDPSVSLARTSSNESLLDLYGVGKGFLGVLNDGTIATNRFLDRAQNADFVVWATHVLRPASNRIVFVEALHAEGQDPGLLRTIGDWAYAAWWQFTLVALVVAFSLGKRLGLPETDRVVQRGGRELIDAYADMLKRSRKPHVALQKIVSDVDRDVKRRFNIAANVSARDRTSRLPERLGQALLQAEVAAAGPISDVSATRLVFDLEDELAKLQGASLKRRRRKR